jgi:formamidopyrimidine-DNA glycosylase
LPELPEVETVVRDLRRLLIGRRITSVRASRQALRRPWSRKWNAALIGRRIATVSRRGKWIMIHVEDEQILVVHLGMTGQLTVVSSERPLADHTHLWFDLDGRSAQLRFRDVRRFGSASLFDDLEALQEFFRLSALGPEPFEVDRAYWREKIVQTNRCLKAVLLDQQVVAGVGNIYADESLFAARLSPIQLGRQTGPREADRLRTAVVAVLRRAIDQRGSSIRDYIGGSETRGRFQNEFSVYGRAGKPCVRCRAIIQRIRLAGRSTHFCPRCQLTKRSTIESPRSKERDRAGNLNRKP